MNIITYTLLYFLAVAVAKFLTHFLGDWSNYVLLGAIFHLYWIKEDA